MKLSKPIIGIGIAIMILSTAFLNAQDVVITKNELPGNAKNFINKYFGGETIAYVKKDKDLLSVEYDVKFSSGTEIQFDSDGIWEEVDGGHRAIPTGFISKKVVNYINKQFPGAEIYKAEKKSFGQQEFKTSSGLELIFNSSGEFIKVDD